MREQAGGGAIVNMSWDHVTSGMAGANPELFSAVKGGVLAYSKSLARALAPGGAGQRPLPGLDRDRVRRAGRRGLPALGGRVDAARGAGARPPTSPRAAVYLASPAAAFVTGQAINVNGGVVM